MSENGNPTPAQAPDPPPQTDPIPLGVVGADGRMGQRLLALAADDPRLQPAGRFDVGTPLTAETGAACRAVIDFSHAAAVPGSINACRRLSIPLVVGTTGLGDAEQALLDEAAADIPVCQASNFSVVVNVLHHLIRQATPLLGPGWDLEVLEAHHRYKVDAPSGTALSLAETLAEAAGRDPATAIQTTRSGHHAPRQPEDITVQTLRIGDHPGEHTVYFAAPGERLELRHVSTSRDSYAVGALRAAAWLVGKPPGRYDIADVLGIR